jgi:hypothetical protein
VLDIQLEHLVEHVDALLRGYEHPRVTTVTSVAGRAAEQQPEVHAGRDLRRMSDADGAKPEVGGLGHRTHRAAAVEGDRELAREREQATARENSVMSFARERGGVVKLAPIKACRRVRADVPDTIGASASADDA